MRVVSLLPSATEICYALGIEPVGVSHECDYPPAAAEKPSVNYSRVDADASSREINDQVAAAQRGEGVYGIHTDVLADLDPDLVVTQGVCDVCAVDEVVVEDALDDIDADPAVVTLDPHTLEDVFEDVRRVGRAAGREDRADEIVEGLCDRVAAVRRRAADVEDRPRVAVLDWLAPPMVAGHWVPGMVEIAGGAYGMADPGERSRPREWTEIREYDPEVLVAAPCGFGLDQTRENVVDLIDRDGWTDLTAVREGRAWAVDGHHYLNRPGPRLVDSLEALAGVVHPDRFEVPPAEAARPIAELTPEEA